MSFRFSLTTTAHRLVTAFVTACRRASRLQVISLTIHRLVTAFATACNSLAHREHGASCAYRAHIIAKELPGGEQQEKASEMCVQRRGEGRRRSYLLAFFGILIERCPVAAASVEAVAGPVAAVGASVAACFLLTGGTTSTKRRPFAPALRAARTIYL